MVQVAGVIFTLLSVMLMAASIFIIHKTKGSFGIFYHKNRCSILAACLTLFVPLLARGVFDCFTGFYRPLFDYFNEHHAESELLLQVILYFFGQLIPLISQLSSLVFGNIRKKSSIRLMSQTQNQGNFAINDLNPRTFSSRRSTTLHLEQELYGDVPGSFFSPKFELLTNQFLENAQLLENESEGNSDDG